MRIIAGKYKGRKLVYNKDSYFRPTLDRVRESIFNVLGEDIVDSTVLDLFCGSGSLGIEALSRAALRAVFVDNNRQIIESAKKNAVDLNTEHKAKFYHRDAFDFIEDYHGLSFDIIFTDPPYKLEYGSKICELVVEKDILKIGGILVLERYKQEHPQPKRLKLVKQSKFGQTQVDYYYREV